MSQTTTTVKRLRQAGMSQAAIAREVGVSQPTIAKWEAGKAPKAADAAIRLQLLGQGVGAPAAEATAVEAGVSHA
ncbi:MAG: helix-turn-helix domain-containing protein [Acidovorax sp.]|uniref:helix-turn-helix transcriptional regulator n=1 Tax=Acidovorax sp. TaxID=1872122 RepID=UPI0025BDE674|nr:helix-turn-helix transcriptional regulator [Acidovorax sp.]MCE1193161.1 helix-turn-helix domain-containing protein [Acidovorax sp.]